MTLTWNGGANFVPVKRSRESPRMTESTKHNTERNPEDWWANFRELLESQTDWPSEYLFKFITPKGKLEAVKSVFEGEKLTVRASSKGKYLSVTARVMVDTPDDVIAIYNAAGSIEGVISL